MRATGGTGGITAPRTFHGRVHPRGPRLASSSFGPAPFLRLPSFLQSPWRILRRYRIVDRSVAVRVFADAHVVLSRPPDVPIHPHSRRVRMKAFVLKDRARSALLATAVCAVFIPGGTVSAATISMWTFEAPNTPANATAALYPDAIAPAIGTGNARGVHASSATAWSTPAGNGSTDSFSSNNWAVGDYYEFNTSTAGFVGVSVSWDQASSNTGPRDFKLATARMARPSPISPTTACLRTHRPTRSGIRRHRARCIPSPRIFRQSPCSTIRPASRSD